MPETKMLKIDPNAPDRETIEFASALLKKGGLVAFPTETVYGIGANFHNAKAIERLYKIKNRPLNKPFTIHISSTDTISEMGCRIGPFAEKLIEHFWPGPLTLILRSRDGSYGFRMPKNAIAKTLISESKVPVVAPSANFSGDEPPVNADKVQKTIGKDLDLILDGGFTELGKESTIVDTTDVPYKILRRGAIGEAEIEDVYREL
ncbi:MAG: L-threonylcarbamoyladenylate synthase [Candidatus Omnitrophota bacterium]